MIVSIFVAGVVWNILLNLFFCLLFDHPWATCRWWGSTSRWSTGGYIHWLCPDSGCGNRSGGGFHTRTHGTRWWSLVWNTADSSTQRCGERWKIKWSREPLKGWSTSSGWNSWGRLRSGCSCSGYFWIRWRWSSFLPQPNNFRFVIQLLFDEKWVLQ